LVAVDTCPSIRHNALKMFPNLHYLSSQFSEASYADSGRESEYYTEAT